MKTLIVVQGGLVTDVITSVPGNEISIIDYDCDEDTDVTILVPQGDGTYCRAWLNDTIEAEVDGARISQILGEKFDEALVEISLTPKEEEELEEYEIFHGLKKYTLYKHREVFGVNTVYSRVYENDESTQIFFRSIEDLKTGRNQLHHLILMDEYDINEAFKYIENKEENLDFEPEAQVYVFNTEEELYYFLMGVEVGGSMIRNVTDEAFLEEIAHKVDFIIQ